MIKDRKKIIFLNKDSSHLVGFTKSLRLNNYDLIEPSSFDETSELIGRGETHLMIFSDGDSEKNKTICRRIAKQYPRMPIIYILANDSEMEAEVKENAHRRIIRPLSQKKQLLNLMVDLLEIGRWVNVSRPLPQDDLFESIDLIQVIDQVLTYFSERVSFENISWLSPDELNRLGRVEGNWKRVEQVQRFGQPANLRTLNDTTEGHLVKALGGFEYPSGYFSEGPWKHLRLGESDPDVIIPVFNPGNTRAIGFLFFEKVKSDDLDIEIRQVEETLSFMSRHISFSVEHYNVQLSNYRDDLTTLYNNNFLNVVLDNEIRSGKRVGREFCLLFVDVDYFKLVNDSKGHWIGSEVLKQLGDLIHKGTRARDYGFRYGGDEFVILLSDTKKEHGELVAERIRKKVEETTFKVDGLELNITVSIGLAAYPKHGKSRKDLIKLADEAMYYGKNKSRNIVYIAS